jgi:hypothetical protein
MASVTLSPTYGWAVGETITAYERDIRNVQTGAAITTAAVAADSTVTFTGLDDDLKLIATDGTYAVRFGTLTDPAESGGGGEYAKGCIVWTSGGVPERPSGFTSVEWVGPDDPDENAEDGDTWVPTEAP